MRLTPAQIETLAMLSWQDRSALNMHVSLRTLEVLCERGLAKRFGLSHLMWPRLAPWQITPLGRETLKLHDKELTQ